MWNSGKDLPVREEPKGGKSESGVEEGTEEETGGKGVKGIAGVQEGSEKTEEEVTAGKTEGPETSGSLEKT